MVHVEGTRSLSCRDRVEKMSGTFVDLALKTGVPIVPVRFSGGLPVEPVATRLEFPAGMGRQDIHLGRPLRPEELRGLHYGARKERVIEAINGLGAPNELEEPQEGDGELVARVHSWQDTHGVSHEHAVLHEILADLPRPCAEIARLLNAPTVASLAGDDGAESLWLSELGRRLLGG